jgi:hypothetical protein
VPRGALRHAGLSSSAVNTKEYIPVSTHLPDGTTVETVIADKDFEVQDPNSTDPDHKRQIVAGQPVPPDLLEAYADASGDKDAKAVAKAQNAPAKSKAQSGPDTSK